ncbi:unnamed protein product [Linum tenue]|uniref:NAC domain-containing protein n=1 Tax=Linum tenue TaxID=586396 RepID=A0AAV0M9Q1_9ROSI|nr:unnamed protein product [Linum tenue]
MARGDSTTFLGPGFRFHPTDEELLRYYLKRKVTNKPVRFDPISVVDVYRTEPWDLPDRSKLKSRDLEWYFFSLLDRKYGNGSKTNRATEKGYWKTTGKDRPIRSNSAIVGMKKTLVYHLGRAPHGERSNWVMHEYRLSDEELGKFGIGPDTYVLCRIFRKSGTGPKNGEQYGAPFVEEEWEDDEVPVVTGQEIVSPDGVAEIDSEYVDAEEFEQKLFAGTDCENVDVPPTFYYEEKSTKIENVGSSDEDGPKPLLAEPLNTLAVPVYPQLPHLSGQNEMGDNCVDAQYIASSSKDLNPLDNGDFHGRPYTDTANSEYAEGLFLEASELSNPLEPRSDPADFNFEDFLDLDELDFDLSDVLRSDDFTSDQSPESDKVSNGVDDDLHSRSENPLSMHGDASSSEQIPDSTVQKPYSMKSETDMNYPFISKASRMLGNIHAPPAMAAEFPVKGAALRYASAQPSSSSIHVTAGMITIENMTLRGDAMDGSGFGKNMGVNVVLSFTWPQGAGGSSLKTGSMASRAWMCLMFFWVLILSVSYKIGISICAK